MCSTDQAACNTAAPLKICLCQPWDVNSTMNTVSVCSRVVLQQSKPKQDSPVQSVVHDSFWMACPSQGSPPLSGAGLVQLRVRFWKPRPQRLLHTDHSVHVDQPPFTVAAEVGDQYMNPYKQHLIQFLLKLFFIFCWFTFCC